MKNRLMFLAALLGILVAGFGAALAQVPIAANSNANMPGATAPVSVMVLPNGTGPQLTNCYYFGGLPANGVITVQLLDAAFDPVPNWPNRSIRINHTPNIAPNWCPDSWYPPPMHAPNCADQVTDAGGFTRFSLAYHGGWWQDRGSQVWVLEATGVWMPIPNDLKMFFNSPDLNGDLAVNLLDVTIFSADLFGPYAYRSDFNWDGDINLLDVIIFSASLGITCP